MKSTKKISDLKVGDKFFATRGGRKTRFRRIDSSGLGNDLAEMNAIQLGGGDNILSVSRFEEGETVKLISSVVDSDSPTSAEGPKMGDPSAAGSVHSLHDPMEGSQRRLTLAQLDGDEPRE